MNWTAQSAALLARFDCRDCHGSGLVIPVVRPESEVARSDADGRVPPSPTRLPRSEVPCTCVCLRVFRVCYRRFRFCVNADSFARTVTFRQVPRGVDRRLVWIRHNEDYCADFQAAGRRVLTPELFRVFRFHHLLGASADLVADRLRTSRPGLYRQIGQIEALVGLELALMQPYSLYPPQEYMRSGTGYPDQVADLTG